MSEDAKYNRKFDEVRTRFRNALQKRMVAHGIEGATVTKENIEKIRETLLLVIPEVYGELWELYELAGDDLALLIMGENLLRLSRFSEETLH